MEILKEAGRVIFLAIVSWLLTIGVIDNILLAVVGDKLDPQYIILVVGVITSVLRGIEKELHNKDSKYQLPV